MSKLREDTVQYGCRKCLSDIDEFFEEVEMRAKSSDGASQQSSITERQKEKIDRALKHMLDGQNVACWLCWNYYNVQMLMLDRL